MVIAAVDRITGIRNRFARDEHSVRRERLERWVTGVIPDRLQPGTYLALVARAPGVDDLGLQVDYRGEEHVVLGRLDPEDFVD